jgi:hypothetical protein
MFPQALVDRYHQARVFYEQGKLDRALALLDDIERKAPNHPEIMHARAVCLHALGRDDEAFLLCNKMFTMHADRRGLELRTRWQAQHPQADKDHFREDFEPPAEPQDAGWNRFYLVAGLAVLAIVVIMVFFSQTRTESSVPPPRALPASPALSPLAVQEPARQDLDTPANVPAPADIETRAEGAAETLDVDHARANP